MVKKLIGHCDCPECSNKLAEVKPTKNGKAYRWCPECLAQYFPKSDAASDALIAKCHTLAKQEQEQEQEAQEQKQVEKPAAVAAPVPAKKKSSAGVFDNLLGAVA